MARARRAASRVSAGPTKRRCWMPSMARSSPEAIADRTRKQLDAGRRHRSARRLQLRARRPLLLVGMDRQERHEESDQDRRDGEENADAGTPAAGQDVSRNWSGDAGDDHRDPTDEGRRSGVTALRPGTE